nr:hypothetical protein [Tanacetum cinerariifolium]
MSLDNASSAVTYTSISSDSDGPSWSIPLMDAESMEEDSIDYLDEPEDDDEDSEEDPEEDHTDYPTDGGDGDDKPSDDEDDDDDTNDEYEEPTDNEEEEEHLAPANSSVVPVVDHVTSAGDTEAFETDESAPTPRSPQTRVLFSPTHLRRARKTVRLEPPMSASMKARIAEHAAAPTPPPPPRHRRARISVLIRSPGHDARTIARAADRVEDESEDFFTQLHDALTESRDIRLEIDEALQKNSTHTQDDRSQSLGGGLRRPVQPAHVCSYTDFMKCQPLNFKGTKGVVGLSQWLEKIESLFHISGCTVDNQVKFASCTLLERQNDNKRKADDSLRNNQQQQPHKKQNVARAYTAGPGEKKAYTRNLPLCTNTITTTSGNVHPSVETARGVNTIIQGCTLNFMNHPFNIDLMHVPLGSFDIIIRMDWSTKYHGVIICDKKIIRVPLGREMDVMYFRHTLPRRKPKISQMRNDLRTCRLSKIPEVFLKDLSGVTPARQVEFQIDLVPGVALVARAAYRLASSEMKELAKQL